MSDTKDGRPAFPCSNEQWSGMSLRDYFASRAMQALIFRAIDAASANGVTEAIELAAKASYAAADAMLAARAKP